MIHDEIHVRLGAGIFRIAEIQQRLVLHDARADGGHLGNDGVFVQQTVLHELVDRHDQRHIRAGDAGGAGAAVPLEHVAVHGDGAGPQLLQIHRRPEGAAHQPLDLSAAGAELQLGDVPLGALPVGPGQHGVLGGDPALPLGDVGRGALLHGGTAQHLGIAAADQAGALRKFVDVGDDLDGAQLVAGPSVDSCHVHSPFFATPAPR